MKEANLLVGAAALSALVAVGFGGTARAAVNVLTLGARNDGSADVSAIVNAATEKDALFFPAGIYKVSKPLWLKHGVYGEGYSRNIRMDATRTWFVSEIDCRDGSVGVLNFTGKANVNVERIAMKCRSFECGISITGCVQSTMTFISQVGVFDGRAAGVRVRGWGSRPVFVQDFTMFGAADWPEGSTGIEIAGAADCRLSNVEIMGTQIGLDLDNGHVYGDNLHLWTGCMAGRDNGRWWKGTRGIVLHEGANLNASQVYPDTSYYAVEQRGRGGVCMLSNVMYWEDQSIKVSPDKTGEFYHRDPAGTGKFVVHGGMIGVSGSWMKKLYSPEADIRDVVVLCNLPIATNNIDLLCFGRTLPDYDERYAERGWCKAADILAAAPTGFCEGRLQLDDGAAWRVTCQRTEAGGAVETKFEPLNPLCRPHRVDAVEADGVARLYVRHESDAPMTVRFTTLAMGDRFRPVDHGFLRCHGSRSARCHEVLPSLDGLEVSWATSMEKVRPRDGAWRGRAAESLRLRLARGETEALQLFVRGAGRDLKGVRVRVSDLLRRRTDFTDRLWFRTEFPAAAVKVSVLGYVETTNVPPYKVVSCATDAAKGPSLTRVPQTPATGWWPDPILDHLESVDVKAGDRQGFWLSFAAPRDQRAGVYEGTVSVEIDGAVVRTIPLAVRVNDFALPAKTPLPTAITFAPGPNVQFEKGERLERAKRLRKDPAAPCNAWRRHAAEWSDFLADHYVTYDNLYHRDLVADATRLPALKKLADDGRLDGFNLGYWDYPKTLSDADKKAWRDATMARLEKSYRAVKEAGLERYAYLYGCDEIDRKYFDCIRWAVAELKAAFPGVPISTTAYDHDYGVGTPLASMDWFTPLSEKYDAKKAAAARKEGRQVWWYICCGPRAPYANMFVECPAIEGRILMGAQTAKYRPDGFLYYQTTLWNAARPISGPSAFTDWSARSWTDYHGDGSWLCAGPDGRPLSTVRFENFRDGLEDFAYVKLLEERLAANPDAPWAERARSLLAVPDSVVIDKTHFTNDPAAVYAWRDAMADLIEDSVGWRRD